MSNKEEKVPRERVDRPYPRVTLENALRVPQALKLKNAGNPWPPDEIAKVLDVGAKTGTFYYVTAGARDYSLTEGTSKTDKVSLTALGKQVVFAPSPDAELAAKRQAFLSVESFRKVLEYYKGDNLPEKQYLANTLTNEFGLHPDVHDEFVDVFKKNCRYVGIGTSYSPGSASDIVANTSIVRAEKFAAAGSAAGGPLCFIIMPFVEREEKHPTGFFKEVLESLIVPAAQKAGFVARTANRSGSDVIQSTIINDLLQADLVVADLTEHNPNVLFELGMRMREDKPVALIKAKGTGRIFDVDNMLRVLEYDPCMWPSTVSTDLPRLVDHIKAGWDNRETGLTYMKLLRQSKLPVEMEREF